MEKFTLQTNEQFNTTEILFEEMPTKETRELLKENNFRWHGKNKVWYGRLSLEETQKLLENCGEICEKAAEQKTGILPLWDRLQTMEKPKVEKKYDTKEIAKVCRTYLKKYFPEVKFSITYNSFSGGSSIDCDIKGSIFDKDSDILKDIRDYCVKFVKQYNYDNSDPYTDYFDVNFYGGYFQTHYDYEVLPCDNLLEIIDDYTTKETKKKEKEHEEFMKRCEEEEKKREKEMQEWEEREKIRKAREEEMLERTKIIDLDEENSYVITNTISNCGKENLEESLGYWENFKDEHKKRDTQITREIVFANEDDYLFFVNTEVLCDLPKFFYKGEENFGGSGTFDTRVDTNGLCGLTKEQIKTIKFYNCNCIALYVGNEIKMLVDPEGFCYARYLIKLCEDSETIPYENYAAREKKLVENQKQFYKPKSLAEQLENCKGKLLNGTTLTTISSNGLGLPAITTWQLVNVEIEKYAQYNDNIKVIGKYKKEKRFTSKLYVSNYHSECLFYLGELPEIPEEIRLPNYEKTEHGISYTMMGGTDNKFWNKIKTYLREQGYEPIIDNIAE